jgi:hypothetical protein
MVSTEGHRIAYRENRMSKILQCWLVHRGTVFGVLFLLLVIGAPPAMADTWRGTAPFCEGHCLAGEHELRRDSNGDGGHCFTGSKALCSNAAPTCRPLQTNVACKGVALVCDNGFYTQSTDHTEWHSCAKFACGACMGWWSDWKEPAKGTAEGVLSVLSVRSLSTLPGNANASRAGLHDGPDTCKPGFVWRLAVANDHVCVSVGSRDGAAADNRQAGSRREPHGGHAGADTCKQGYVWRGAVPTDHVCVTAEVHRQTLAENAQFETNRARGALW